MSKRVIAVGAGLGGLSAAIHARLKGHQVLVLEGRDRVGGKAAGLEQDGFRLDPGPSIIILTRLYADVFRRAGKRMEDYLTFRRLEPISRVLFDGKTIDLPATREGCQDVVRQFAPEDADSFSALMDKLDAVGPLIDKSIFDHPYEHWWQLADPKLISVATKFNVRVTYKELVDGMFSSPLLRAFFYGFPSYGGQTYDSKAPGALMIPYLMIKEGVWYPEGGVAAIPAAFARLAQELGVEIRTNARVDEFVLDGDRLTGVLAGGNKMDADAVIANMDRLSVEQHLGFPLPEGIRPSLSYFTIHWGIRRRIPGLEHHTLVIPRDFEPGFEALYRRREMTDQPIVYLNDTTATDPSVAPPGMTNLFAVVTSPAREDHFDWNRAAEAGKAHVRNVLREAGIDFTDDEIVMERVQSPLTFEERDGNFRGTLYGADERFRHLGGLFPLTNRHPRLQNLFFAGGSVQPGAGLPMVTLSGRFAAEALGK